jgi:hypothetical protein
MLPSLSAATAEKLTLWPIVALVGAAEALTLGGAFADTVTSSVDEEVAPPLSVTVTTAE